MRFKATIGALVAGGIWLVSAAAVRNLDDPFDTTCLGTSAEGTVRATLGPSSSATSLQQVTTLVPNSNCSSTAAEQASESPIPSSSTLEVVTVTIVASSTPRSSPATASSLSSSLPADWSSLNFQSSQPGSPSSPCASSQVSHSAAQSTAVTFVTVTEFSDLFTTITVTPPTASSTTTGSVVPTATSEDSPAFATVTTVTVTTPATSGPVSSVTALEPFGSEVTSVLTLTFPDGFRHTSTVLVTITIPDVPVSELWSTVVTPSGVPATPVTVGCSTEPSSPYRPYAVTYTLSPESGLPTPFTGTITITPSSPPPRWMRSSSPVNSLSNTVISSLEPLPTVSSTSDEEPDTVTITVTAVGSPSPVSQTSNISFGSSTKGTPVPYGSALNTGPSSFSATLPLATSTILTVSLSETNGYGSIASGSDISPTFTSSSPSLPAPAPPSSQTGSVVFVTYTVPGQSGIGASTYTVTYTQLTPTDTSWPEASGSSTSSDDALFTNSGGYQGGNTDSVLPTSGFSEPTPVIVTETIASPSPSAVISTVIVSVVTLSQTVPLGYSSSTIVEFTTKLSVAPCPDLTTASESTVLITSLVPTWTAPSEVTIWPAPIFSSSCSTFSTSYLSLTGSGTAPLFSITTLLPATSSNAPDGTNDSSSFINTPLVSCSESNTPVNSEHEPQTESIDDGNAATGVSTWSTTTTTLGGYVFSTSSDEGYGNPAQSAPLLTTNSIIPTESASPVSHPTPASSSPFAYGSTESADPNQTSTTTSSFPLVSDLSSTLPVTHSSLSVNSTASSPSSSQHLTSTSTLVANTTTAPPTIAVSTAIGSTLLSSTSVLPPGVSSSSTAGLNDTASAPPVIMTLTLTTTLTSATVSGSLPTPSFTSFTTSVVVLTTAAPFSTTSATSSSARSLPLPPTPANGTSISTTPIITSSSLVITAATSPSSVPLLSTTLPVLNSTSASTSLATNSSSFLSSPTSTASVHTVLPSSTTLATSSSTLLLPPTSTASVHTVLPTSPTLATNSSALLPPPAGTLSVFTASLSSTGLADTSTIPSTFVLKVVSTSSTSDQVTSSPTVPAQCDAAADRDGLILGFEDIYISAGRQPVPDPYHRLSFSDQFQVVSQRPTNSTPTSNSSSQVLQLNPTSTGEIQLGQQRDNPCFRFDFQSVKVGCSSVDDPCVFRLSGLRWDNFDGITETELFTVPPCPDEYNCTLHHLIVIPPAFTNLTGLRIAPNGTQTSWVDDVEITWTDNSCSAAICRSQVPITDPMLIPRRLSGGQIKRHIRWGARG